jgi:hypothetical protein
MKTDLRIKAMMLAVATIVVGACSDDDPSESPTGGDFTVFMAGAPRFQVETGVDNTPLELSVSVATVEIAKTVSPIQATVKVDESLVASFNASNGTNYEVLPAETYSITTSATIPAGENVVAFPIIVQDHLLEGLKTYLLPVVIDQVQGASIQSDDITRYLVIRTNYVELVRSAWTVEASSEEPTEAQYGHGGYGWALADNANQTFWHTRWNGGNDEPPYYVIVDMKQNNSIHGFTFLGRQDNTGEQWGRFKAVQLAVSADGENFTDAGSISGILNTEAAQTFYLEEPAASARYFKLTVTDWYGKESGAKYVHLAELRVY